MNMEYGIPEMNLHGDKIIYYKGVNVGCTPCNNIGTLEEANQVKKIFARCQYLDSIGEAVSKYSLEEGWAQHVNGFLEAQNKKLHQSMAGCGLIFSRINVAHDYDGGSFLLPGNPPLERIRTAIPYQDIIENRDDVEVYISKFFLLFGGQPARLATMTELDLITSCYDCFKWDNSFKLLSNEVYSVHEKLEVEHSTSNAPVSSIDLLPF